MVQIPLSQQTTTFTTANATSVILPRQNTEMLELVSRKAFDELNRQMEQQGQAEGAEAQRQDPGATPSKPFLGSLTAYGRGVIKGQNEVYASSKDIELTTKARELMDQFRGDPDGFKTAFEGYRKEWLKNVPGDLALAFSTSSDRMMSGAMGQLQVQKLEFQRDQQRTDAESKLDLLRTQAYDGLLAGKPVDTVLAQYTGMIEGLVNSKLISPSEGKKLLDRFGDTVHEGEVVGGVRRGGNFDGVINALKRGDNVGSFNGRPLTPEQRERLISKVTSERAEAQRQANLASAAASRTAAKLVDDDIKSITDTGVEVVTDDYIAKSIRNPAAVQEWRDKRKEAHETFRITQQVKTSTPEEDRVLAEQSQPTPGATDYAIQAKTHATVLKAIQAKNTALATDPGGYIAKNNPEIGRMIASEDPDVRQQGYDLSRQMQTRMGVPAAMQSALPRLDLGRIAASINDPDPVKAGENLLKAQLKYGSEWQNIYDKLALDSNGKLAISPAMAVVASLNGPRDADTRNDLTAALKLRKENAETVSRMSKAGDPISKKITDEVTEGMRDWSTAVTAGGGNRDQVNNMQDAVIALANHYAAGGMDPKEAAQTATRKLVTDRYQSGKTFYTQQGLLPKAEGAVDAVKKSLTLNDVRPVDVDPRDLKTPEQIRKEQERRLKEAIPVMDPRGRGLVLIYPSKHPVLKPDGSPFLIPWDQIGRYEPGQTATITKPGPAPSPTEAPDTNGPDKGGITFTKPKGPVYDPLSGNRIDTIPGAPEQ